jgi:hypothetical protein
MICDIQVPGGIPRPPDVQPNMPAIVPEIILAAVRKKDYPRNYPDNNQSQAGHQKKKNDIDYLFRDFINKPVNTF